MSLLYPDSTHMRKLLDRLNAFRHAAFSLPGYKMPPVPSRAYFSSIVWFLSGGWAAILPSPNGWPRFIDTKAVADAGGYAEWLNANWTEEEALPYGGLPMLYWDANLFHSSGVGRVTCRLRLQNTSGSEFPFTNIHLEPDPEGDPHFGPWMGVYHPSYSSDVYRWRIGRTDTTGYAYSKKLEPEEEPERLAFYADETTSGDPITAKTSIWRFKWEADDPADSEVNVLIRDRPRFSAQLANGVFSRFHLYSAYTELYQIIGRLNAVRITSYSDLTFRRRTGPLRPGRTLEEARAASEADAYTQGYGNLSAGSNNSAWGSTGYRAAFRHPIFHEARADAPYWAPFGDVRAVRSFFHPRGSEGHIYDSWGMYGEQGAWVELPNVYSGEDKGKFRIEYRDEEAGPAGWPPVGDDELGTGLVDRNIIVELDIPDTDFPQ